MSNLVFAWPYAAIAFMMLIFMWLYHKNHHDEQGFLFFPHTLTLKVLAQTKTAAKSARTIDWFMSLLWIFLVLALMRPQLVGNPIEISRNGRNIMLVVDISESMEIADMKLGAKSVDRLTAAKEVINHFIDKRIGDRIGLLVFGSEAFLHAPLSFDHHLIKQFLADAQIGFAGPKTALGDATGLGVKKLIEQTQGDRIIVLLTDGQNNAGSLLPMDAAHIAGKQNIKIYIAGLGSSRMVVDGFFGPQTVNPSLSLDEAEPELKNMANFTGGKYFRAHDSQALDGIYQEIDHLEPILAEPIILVPKKEMFFWPLSLAMVMVLGRLSARLRKSNVVG